MDTGGFGTKKRSMMEKRIKDNFEQAIKILEATPQEEFSMLQYRRSSLTNRQNVPFYSQDDCGTVGCALGTIAVKGTGKLRPNHYDYSNYKRLGLALEWEKYSNRVFDIIPYVKGGSAWSFLFSHIWTDYDDSPRGAAARIRYYLDNEDKIESGKWKYEDFKKDWEFKKSN